MIKTFGLLVGLAWSWCGSDAPGPGVAPVPAPPSTLAAPACAPLSGPETGDIAISAACDGCRQKYFSNMGLPAGVTFDACVTASIAGVRAKLAIDPHRYDAVVPKVRRRP